MRRSTFLLCLLGLASLTAGFSPSSSSSSSSHWHREKVVVANRGSGNITVLDVHTDRVIGTRDLPAGPNKPEPMYVVFSAYKHRVFVGDRANNRVVVFDAQDFRVVGTVPTGAGVWHMWADLLSEQLWVANDIDKTMSVIDPKRLTTLKTVPLPVDLVALGGRPHDVIVEPFGGAAYVSIVGVTGPDDYVVRFNTRTFKESGRAKVGKDPHLSLTWRNHLLYVPAQNANTVHVLDRGSMKRVRDIAVSGAHGAGMTFLGDFLYTTNFPGGGTSGIYTIDTRTNALVGQPVNTPHPGPHNVAVTLGGKVYVTHSGATADKVTIYRTNWWSPVPVLKGEATAGTNPFGIAWIPY